MAKLGAMTALTLDGLEAGAEVVEVERGEPGGTDDRVHTVVGAPHEVLACGVDHGEVDRDLGAGVGQGNGIGGDLQARGVDADLAQVDARVQRIDRGDQLEPGIVEHRLAHGGAHAPGRAEHADSDHRLTLSAAL